MSLSAGSGASSCQDLRAGLRAFRFCVDGALLIDLDVELHGVPSLAEVLTWTLHTIFPEKECERTSDSGKAHQP